MREVLFTGIFSCAWSVCENQTIDLLLDIILSPESKPDMVSEKGAQSLFAVLGTT